VIGVLQSDYDRKTGKLIKEEIVEILDMTIDEYYAPLVEILGKDLLKKLDNENTNKSNC
jgi:hypothetical protein